MSIKSFIMIISGTFYPMVPLAGQKLKFVQFRNQRLICFGGGSIMLWGTVKMVRRFMELNPELIGK